MSKSTEEAVLDHCKQFQHFLMKSKIKFENKLYEKVQENCILDNINILKCVGRGSFGKVVCCTYANRPGVFAMKILEKLMIIKCHQLRHTVSEIKFLSSFNFIFIISLEFFTKNNVYLFIVMPFINGGDMFSHLRNLEKFNEELCKFYAAQISFALEYMHAMGVVYRDIKPENILIDLKGYLKITDLGFCKKIDSERTYTACGTPEYLAPEIILSIGYSYGVDWWSYGVILFEMAAGYPPFYSQQHMKLYEKIVSATYMCPEHFSQELKDLISNLLQVDKSKRYGVLKNGVKDIKMHDWFEGINFEAILRREQKAPFVPQVENETDMKYFRHVEDLSLRTGSFNEFEQQFKSIRLEKE